MHIAVDGGTWTNARGYGRFTREILTAAVALPSRHRFTLVADQVSELGALPDGLACARAPVSRPPAEAASAAGRRSIADMRAMSRALAAQNADCIFFPSVYTYVPVITRVPVVVCIHDVIPERFPEHVFPTRRGRLFWTLKTRAALRQAARIVTVSRHARDEIAAHFGLDAAAIPIVPEAAAAAFGLHADAGLGRRALADAGLAPDTRFVMYVGGLAPHKNLAMAIDTIAALRTDACFADVMLLIVGDHTRDVFHSAYPELRGRAMRANSGTVFMGALPDAATAGLMRLAQMLVLPSLDEGFGLPAIEAAACGTAVVATTHSAMPDVLGDAAWYIDPRDADGLRSAISSLLADDERRRALGLKAADRARAYTWTSAARQLLGVFDALTSEHGARGQG